METFEKMIIELCPACYEYYTIEGQKHFCCYVEYNKNNKHNKCSEISCYLKSVIGRYTWRKGTIQEQLRVKYINDYEE